MRIKLPKMLKAAMLDAIGYELIDDEDDDEEEEVELEGDNLIVVNKTRKILMDVQDDWVRNYLIN
jgi:hypothetical protein